MTLQDHIKIFYRGERITHAALAGFGLTCVLGGSAYHYLSNSALSYGVLFGVGLIGAFQILVGLVRFIRTFGQFNKAIDSAKNNASYLKENEFNKIDLLIKKYHRMRNVESIIFVVAMLIFAIGWALKADKFLLGTAAGLCLHTAMLLVFDLFSQSRTQEYQHQIGKLIDGYQSEIMK